jgi:pimeloyl-ACP methyl ester carboxylesterase
MQLHILTAGMLEVAYLDEGPRTGPPVVLLHGFPYDVHACRVAGERLVGAGCRVITPYLRGFGATRFLDPRTPRSGQQAALAFDLLALLDALAIPSAVLAGYDWGGRAACILAALHPERVRGLVTGNGYNLQNIAAAAHPQSPENEQRLWYQYYLHGARGAAGLAQNRQGFCKLLWQLWSPHWQFDDATFERSAAAFDNPDFIDVVVHSYRHRFGLVAGDPVLDDWERALAAQPRIGVPTIAIDGADDGVTTFGGSAQHQNHFTGPYQHRVLPLVGHNLPQEAPREFAAAVLELL